MNWRKHGRMQQQLGENEKTTEKLSEDSQSPSKNLILRLPKYVVQSISSQTEVLKHRKAYLRH
jgi:hypothetical protein